MTSEAWWGFAAVVGQGLATYGYRLFNGRLTRSEARIVENKALADERLAKMDDKIERIIRRDSERVNQTQIWYGKVEIRLALLEARHDDDPPPHRKPPGSWQR